GANVDGLAPEYLFHGIGRRGDEAIVRIHERRTGVVDRPELRRDPFRTYRAHPGLQLRGSFFGTLIGHQPCAYLGHGARGDHCTRRPRRESAANAMYLERWPGP